MHQQPLGFERNACTRCTLAGVATLPSGKNFRIMTIDIHTVQNGKLVAAHHIEDWAGAIRQLSTK